jgi:hypothetical protein
MESQGMAQYLLKASTIKLGTRRFSHLVLVDGVLAKIPLDPLDKELERRGHRFARYTALGGAHDDEKPEGVLADE